MNLKIVLAGAASALLVGTFAVAQTTGSTSGTTSPGAAGTTSSDMNQPGAMGSGAVNDQNATTSATGADAYGADTAAQTDASMAGERG
jgi:hypothetical protein